MSEVYDLKQAAARFARFQRGPFILLLVLAGVLLIGAVPVLTSGSGGETGNTIAWIAIAGAVALVCIDFTTNGPLPVRLRLDDRGATFLLSNGKTRVYRWDQHDLKLRFVDMRGRPDAITHPNRYGALITIEMPLFIARPWPLTSEAYGGLLSTAQRNGLTVSPPTWAEPAHGRRRVVLSSSPGPEG
jgi:hypothetical protein